MRHLGPREVPGLAPHQPANSRQSWDLNPRIWPQSLMAFASMPSVIFYCDVLLSLELQQHLMLISPKTLFIFFNMYVFMGLHWSSWWDEGFSVVACEISCGMWDPVPWPEIKPAPCTGGSESATRPQGSATTAHHLFALKLRPLPFPQLGSMRAESTSVLSVYSL